MEHRDEDLATVVDARAGKVSAKAMEERLQHAVSTGKAKLAKLTGEMKQIHQAMDESGDGYLTVIQTKMVEFNKLSSSLNLRLMVLQVFTEKVEAWIKEAQLPTEEATVYNEVVQPSDSISGTSFPSLKQGSKAASGHSSHAPSSASFIRLKAELEGALLLAKATTLKRETSFGGVGSSVKKRK